VDQAILLLVEGNERPHVISDERLQRHWQHFQLDRSVSCHTWRLRSTHWHWGNWFLLWSSLMRLYGNQINTSALTHANNTNHRRQLCLKHLYRHLF